MPYLGQCQERRQRGGDRRSVITKDGWNIEWSMGQVIYLPAARMVASISNNSSLKFPVLESWSLEFQVTLRDSWWCALLYLYLSYSGFSIVWLTLHFLVGFVIIIIIIIVIGGVLTLNLAPPSRSWAFLTFPDFRGFLLVSLGSRQGRSFSPTDPNRIEPNRNSSAPMME